MDSLAVLRKGELSELLEFVTAIINDIEKGLPISSHLSSAVEYIYPFLKRMGTCDSKPLVVGPDKGLSFLVSYQLNAIYSVQLHKLIADEPAMSDNEALALLRNLQALLMEYSPIKEECFSAQKVQSLLKKANTIGSLNIISPPESRLYVLCLPYRHKLYNSQYIGSMNIILTSVARNEEKAGHPDYIFLHELGHAYHNHLTQGRFDLPESFMPVLELGFQTDFLDSNNALEIFREIFADCFTVAVSNSDKRLSGLNPFYKVMSPMYRQVLSFYFRETGIFSDMIKATSTKTFWTRQRKAFLINIYEGCRK